MRTFLEDLPDYMREGLRRYFDHGIIPGSFLRAVLENDLATACQYADEINILCLRQYVWFLEGQDPSAWGSPEKVRAWAIWKSGALTR